MNMSNADNIIEIRDVSFRHKQAETDSLYHVSLSIRKGECVLLCGESGSGKTTLTRLINGLIPHFYEGELTGDTKVAGQNVTEAELYETARIVGSVFQNPRSQIFCVDTRSELAFGCENMGLDEDEIRTRVNHVAKELQIEQILGKSIFGLSGGQKQKIACGSVSAMMPEVFVLDEPTSNLDLDAIEEVKRVILTWKEQGRTIVIAEHRLFWLKEVCDRVICMKRGTVAFDVSMEEFCNAAPETFDRYGLRSIHEVLELPEVTPASFEDTFILHDFRYVYDKTTAIQIDELNLPQGGIIAVTGVNGAGKTTFARCLCGLQKKFRGMIESKGGKKNRKALLKQSYMVMQDVNHQLFCETVEEEVKLGMQEESTADISFVLESLGLNGLLQNHPMAVSGGEKQRIAIACAVLAGKEVLVFDEPTSGQDYGNMKKTAELIRSLGGKHTVFVITHDPAFIRACCTHLIRLDRGKVVLNGRIKGNA